MAKGLIDEGTIAWNSISQNNLRVQWESAVFEIEEQFMKIACCTTRSLSQQDFELLRKIAGCQDYMAQENFEKMWCWLYLVALTLSSDRIKAMWNSTSPKWIEGFVTKEEVELSLQGPRSLQEPGTFILRFPTSRSWPHPDAGSLVVTYVGSDYALHHRLISLDNVYSSGVREMNVKVKQLQDMLFEEPELSRLGRIIRRH
ncbi:SH2 domain-containing protein B-like [Hibiscus syriacus]|uniref:SH2 domain-containing protein B-like n=1 Tax=Hibiscus syriacus TaxID=106335 RepID=UPI001924DFB6|nr:SH2 domain-containing protein B-like [Hibiscus syriacus]